MRKVIFAFVLLALVAPFAAADTPVEATPQDAAPLVAAEAPAADGEVSLEEILAEMDPTADAESKYLCMPGSCTTAWDCEMNQDPYACSNRYMCDNPTGQACRGTCSCC